MAKTIRADLPEQKSALRERLAEFGIEAQVALRHAVVFLAEAASGGAEGAADMLNKGSQRAKFLAETLKRDTAVTVAAPKSEPSKS
jgi:hypothetical protein